MRLKFATSGGVPRRTPLDEGNPLPPDDRVIDLPRSRLDALYRDQAPSLLRFFARRSHKSDAEDLVSESFVRFAGSSAVQEDAIDNPEGYLHEVAKNVLRNRARAAFHRSIVCMDIDDACSLLAADPTASLEARDMLARLQSALEKLPPKTRMIFMAHRLDGASYAELAKAHSLSVKGIEWHMSKAMAQLHRVAGKR
jgi:RNA polymerase sigma-70 factor (ECF subfamily)